jgi:hypothetical protein
MVGAPARVGGAGPVSAYAIDDGARLILIDPIAVPDDVRALFGSREVVTVLTSTWHERDAASLGFPVWAPAPDRPEDQLVPATRYAIGDSLFGMEAAVVSTEGPLRVRSRRGGWLLSYSHWRTPPTPATARTSSPSARYSRAYWPAQSFSCKTISVHE